MSVWLQAVPAEALGRVAEASVMVGAAPVTVYGLVPVKGPEPVLTSVTVA